MSDLANEVRKLQETNTVIIHGGVIPHRSSGNYNYRFYQAVSIGPKKSIVVTDGKKDPSDPRHVDFDER